MFDFYSFKELSQIALDISEKIELFKPYVVLIQSLKRPGMTTRHFETINERTGIAVAATSSQTLKDILQLGVMNFMETVLDVADNAAKEYFIEAALNKMTNECAQFEMEIISYKNTGTFIMKIADEIQLTIDEYIINTQQMGFSPFRALFENSIVEWESKLKLTQEVLTEWIAVQK